MKGDLALFDKVKSGVSSQVMGQLKENFDKKKRIQQSIATKAAAHFEANSTDNTYSNIVFPKYKLDSRLNVQVEHNAPPKEIFEPLGWDRVKGESSEKHYRKFYTDELENVKEVMSTPTDFN